MWFLFKLSALTEIAAYHIPNAMFGWLGLLLPPDLMDSPLRVWIESEKDTDENIVIGVKSSCSLKIAPLSHHNLSLSSTFTPARRVSTNPMDCTKIIRLVTEEQ